jgi:hypothetical protein
VDEATGLSHPVGSTWIPNDWGGLCSRAECIRRGGDGDGDDNGGGDGDSQQLYILRFSCGVAAVCCTDFHRHFFVV